MFSLYEKEGKPRIGIFSKDEDTQDDMLSWALSMEESDALVTKTELEDGTIHYGYKRLNEFLEKKASQLTARDIKGETNFSEETERTVEEITKPAKAKKAKAKVEEEYDEDLPFNKAGTANKSKQKVNGAYTKEEFKRLWEEEK